MDKTTEDKAKVTKRVPCEVYSRIVGYLRPVQDWNEGKQQEFAERETYNVNKAADQDSQPSGE
jgi:anaerobic ribonucleoside-triphosphate reductase